MEETAAEKDNFAESDLNGQGKEKHCWTEHAVQPATATNCCFENRVGNGKIGIGIGIAIVIAIEVAGLQVTDCGPDADDRFRRFSWLWCPSASDGLFRIQPRWAASTTAN